MEKRFLLMIFAGGMALVCLFYIISTALPSWTVFEVSGGKAEAGLWSACGSYEGIKSCARITDCSGSGCGKLYAARAFMILAILFSAASVACLLAVLAPNIGSNPAVAAAVKGLPLACLLFGIIGVALGISVYSDLQGKLGAAAILGIVALVLNLLVGIGAAMTQFLR